MSIVAGRLHTANVRHENEDRGLRVLVVDDDSIGSAITASEFHEAGHEAVLASSADEALHLLRTVRPDAMLLDGPLRDTDGIELLTLIRKDSRFDEVPVILMAPSPSEEDRKRACTLGALDYLPQPLDSQVFFRRVRAHIARPKRHGPPSPDSGRGGDDVRSAHLMGKLPSFLSFLESVAGVAGLEPQGTFSVDVSDLYTWSRLQGVREEHVAQMAADHLGLPYVDQVHSQELALDLLPRSYCRSNHVLPILTVSGAPGVVVANPFDDAVIQEVGRQLSRRGDAVVRVTSPRTILRALDAADKAEHPESAGEEQDGTARGMVLRGVEAGIALRASHASRVANDLIERTVRYGASDLHIEGKDDGSLVRCRVDGIMEEMERMPKELGMQLISRLKALAGMDIAEKRRPQDGALDVEVDGRYFKLRLASTSGPNGESMVIRFLEPQKAPPLLSDLGMRPDQAEHLKAMAGRNQGLILFVGPTGSGKSTSIYSMLAHVDVARRKLLSVENPVEYRIPLADQQQVNDAAGVTFEALLKSTVRQDPDILFLGEIRDLHSAKAAMDFASSGHLTVSSIHSANATTTIFRLERLGLARGTIGEALMGVVSQKLVPKLCPHCKETRQPTDWEVGAMSPFTDDIPDKVADSSGCPSCRHTGYMGREGIFEVIEFDSELKTMIREGVAIFDIRRHLMDRGEPLICHHGMEKIRSHTFSVRDVANAVLMEDRMFFDPREPGPDTSPPAAVEPVAGDSNSKKNVLVVDDDPTVLVILEGLLTKAGYDVTVVNDGTKALVELGKRSFSLILSDISMPLLDGIALLKSVKEMGIQTPVILITGSTGPEAEVTGLEAGAVDFIRKPIDPEVLLLRVTRVLGPARAN